MHWNAKFFTFGFVGLAVSLPVFIQAISMRTAQNKAAYRLICAPRVETPPVNNC